MVYINRGWVYYRDYEDYGLTAAYNLIEHKPLKTMEDFFAARFTHQDFVRALDLLKEHFELDWDIMADTIKGNFYFENPQSKLEQSTRADKVICEDMKDYTMALETRLYIENIRYCAFHAYCLEVLQALIQLLDDKMNVFYETDVYKLCTA